MKHRAARLLSVVLLPLHSGMNWRPERYSGISPNEYDFTPQALRIRVDSSSSPLFFPLEKNVMAKRLEVEASTNGLPKRGHDDFVLRVGLITAGDYRPSWLERVFAAKWILNLVALKPDAGLGQIIFYNVVQGGEKPTADKRMVNHTVKVVGQPGDLGFSVPLDPALDVGAVWLHADGDDTKSKFTVTVKKIALTE